MTEINAEIGLTAMLSDSSQHVIANDASDEKDKDLE